MFEQEKESEEESNNNMYDNNNAGVSSMVENDVNGNKNQNYINNNDGNVSCRGLSTIAIARITITITKTTVGMA